MTRYTKYPEVRAERAIDRYGVLVLEHAEEWEQQGCPAPNCSLCAAWRVWARHPEWQKLPDRWWKGEAKPV